jgi:hypothetical protein
MRVLTASSVLQGTSALKMETASFSETLASTSQSTRRHNPKEYNQNSRRQSSSSNVCLDHEAEIIGKHRLGESVRSCVAFSWRSPFLSTT